MTAKIEDLPRSLFHSFNNEYSREALVDMSESLLDSATQSILNNEVLVKLPVVGGLVAVGKGILDFRDRQFVSKLLRVLAETSNINPNKMNAFKEELNNKPHEARRAGAILLDLIDKSTGAQKAAMIGKIIRAKVEENFSYEDLINLCEMVEKAYLSDLLAIARKEGGEGPRWNDVNLEGVGIKKPMRSEDVNDAIAASINMLQREMPTIREKPLRISLKKPHVYESGFTDMGATLQRILQDY